MSLCGVKKSKIVIGWKKVVRFYFWKPMLFTGIPTQITKSDVIISWMEHVITCTISYSYRHLECSSHSNMIFTPTGSYKLIDLWVVFKKICRKFV